MLIRASAEFERWGLYLSHMIARKLTLRVTPVGFSLIVSSVLSCIHEVYKVAVPLLSHS